jgi:hypothetical protein
MRSVIFRWLVLYLGVIVVSHCSSSNVAASLFFVRDDSAVTTDGVGSSSRAGGGAPSKRWSDDSPGVSLRLPNMKNSSPSQISDLASGGSSSTVVGTKKVACGLYIWNAPSALLHKWCTHLLRECIYEGRGGVKFVRIEPGSILQLLYPSLRHYRPDSCLLCGGTYQDHLALAWAKHLYTPLDRRLDDDYNKGRLEMQGQEDMTKISRHASQKVKAKTTRTRPSSSSFSSSTRRGPETRGRNSARSRRKHLPTAPPEPQILYSFHRQYVVDATDLIDALRQQRQGKHQRKGQRHRRLPPGDIQQQELIRQLQSKIGGGGGGGCGGNSQTLELRKNSNYFNLSLQPPSTRTSPHPSPPTSTLPSNQASGVSSSLPRSPAESPAPNKRNLYYIVPVPTTTTATSSSGSSSSSKGGGDTIDPPALIRSKKNPTRVAALFVVRSILMGGLDNLIELEALDNAKEKERQRIGKGILLHRE